MIAPATFFAIFFVVWWICLFVVLPFGVRTQADSGEVIAGTEAGAPITPRLGRSLIYTTLLSIPVTGLLMWALSASWLQQYWS